MRVRPALDVAGGMSDETETIQQQDDEFDDVYGETPPVDEYRLSTS
jgi:hypothetical protein